VFKLYSVRKLSLQSNVFKALPESLGDLSRLRRLNIDRCSELSSMPLSLTRLTQLQSIKCRGTSLPPSAWDGVLPGIVEV
jgi:hypothetical protein